MLLTIQEKEAVWWRNACVLYFQTFSKMPIPKGLKSPIKVWNIMKACDFRYAPELGVINRNAITHDTKK